MQITEASADGLKHTFKVVIPAQDIETKVQSRLAELAKTAHLPGFRPGKAPMAVIKGRYGLSARGEVLEDLVNDSSSALVRERGLRPALQPRIEADGEYKEGQDFGYSLTVESLPDIEPMDFAALTLERLVAPVDDADLSAALERLAQARRTSKALEEPRPAQSGDTVVIDFKGTVNGESHPGLNADGYYVILGSGTFIDSFESQLEGASSGEHRTVNVTFPDDYGSPEFAGKAAVFAVDVKEVRETVTPVVDDELAKEIGLDDLETLKLRFRERLERDRADASRQRLKRGLLDILAEKHDFPVPEGMVEIEFRGIWQQLEQELAKQGGLKVEDSGRSEDAVKAEYRTIAERRVRLGLLLSEVGTRHKIEVSDAEINQAMFAEVRRYPGYERNLLEYYGKNPRAKDRFRIPVFEDKVVDLILESAQISEKTVSMDELMRDPDADESPQAA